MHILRWQRISPRCAFGDGQQTLMGYSQLLPVSTFCKRYSAFRRISQAKRDALALPPWLGKTRPRRCSGTSTRSSPRDRGRAAAEPAYSPCSREPALPDGGSAGKGLHPIGSKSRVRQAKQLQPAYGGTTVLISNRAAFVNTPRKRQRYLEFKNVLQVKVS